MQSPRGTLTLTNEDSLEYYEFVRLGYERVEKGTKKKCEAYMEEFLAEQYLISE